MNELCKFIPFRPFTKKEMYSIPELEELEDMNSDIIWNILIEVLHKEFPNVRAFDVFDKYALIDSTSFGGGEFNFIYILHTKDGDYWYLDFSDSNVNELLCYGDNLDINKYFESLGLTDLKLNETSILKSVRNERSC